MSAISVASAGNHYHTSGALMAAAYAASNALTSERPVTVMSRRARRAPPSTIVGVSVGIELRDAQRRELHEIVRPGRDREAGEFGAGELGAGELGAGLLERQPSRGCMPSSAAAA